MAEVDIYRQCVKYNDDWSFVRGLIHHAPSNVLPAVMCAYLSSWRAAAIAHPTPARKEGAGRYAANTRLRHDSKKMEQGDVATRKIYARLVQEGPRPSCATCARCTLEGVCTVTDEYAKNLCEKWCADFT